MIGMILIQIDCYSNKISKKVPTYLKIFQVTVYFGCKFIKRNLKAMFRNGLQSHIREIFLKSCQRSIWAENIPSLPKLMPSLLIDVRCYRSYPEFPTSSMQAEHRLFFAFLTIFRAGKFSRHWFSRAKMLWKIRGSTHFLTQKIYMKRLFDQLNRQFLISKFVRSLKNRWLFAKALLTHKINDTRLS